MNDDGASAYEGDCFGPCICVLGHEEVSGPDDYDARRVGPCMKRILRKLGYNGPVTITAVGSLAKVPRDILEAVSSTGISLYHEFYSKHFSSLFPFYSLY